MIPKSTDGKVRVLSISYGKDSLACLGALEILQWPLDAIVTADVMYSDTISADYPTVGNFKKKMDERILQEYGIKVEHFSGVAFKEKTNYLKEFHRAVLPKTVERRRTDYSIRKSKNNKTNILTRGFPLRKAPWCNGKLKMSAIREMKKSFKGKDVIQYIGIAADEPDRIERHGKKLDTLMPLVEVGWAEADAKQWCIDHDMLSPAYSGQRERERERRVLVLPQSINQQPSRSAARISRIMARTYGS